jgi:uncharacterized membrane protein (DUF485 family)
MTPEKYVEAQQSADFARLRSALRRHAFSWTVAFFVWYALYVLLSAYARDFMGKVLFANINVALVFGLLQFVTTFVIAWRYSRYANKHVDPIADQIQADLESGTSAKEEVSA